MEGGSGGGDRERQRPQGLVAPFVAKTYHMVSDPATDGWIRWGRHDNSFVVFDPPEFSQRLLRSYFKHDNFSSFVRQLNTYGFRKVDFDRWEFAHESFLRGQIHLLPSIVRRKKTGSNSAATTITIAVAGGGGDVDGGEAETAGDEEQMLLLLEIGRLKQEQRSLDEALHTASRRLQATEGWYQRMVSVLGRVVEDPNFRHRLAQQAEKQQQQQLVEKRRRTPRTTPPPRLPLPNGALFCPFDGVLAWETAGSSVPPSAAANTVSTLAGGAVAAVPYFDDGVTAVGNGLPAPAPEQGASHAVAGCSIPPFSSDCVQYQ